MCVVWLLCVMFSVDNLQLCWVRRRQWLEQGARTISVFRRWRSDEVICPKITVAQICLKISNEQPSFELGHFACGTLVQWFKLAKKFSFCNCWRVAHWRWLRTSRNKFYTEFSHVYRHISSLAGSTQFTVCWTHIWNPARRGDGRLCCVLTNGATRTADRTVQTGKTGKVTNCLSSQNTSNLTVEWINQNASQSLFTWTCSCLVHSLLTSFAQDIKHITQCVRSSLQCLTGPPSFWWSSLAIVTNFWAARIGVVQVESLLIFNLLVVFKQGYTNQCHMLETSQFILSLQGVQE